MEAEIDEDKPMIVKNSIHARKTLQRRAKTNKFRRGRSSSTYQHNTGSSALLLCLYNSSCFYFFFLHAF